MDDVADLEALFAQQLAADLDGMEARWAADLAAAGRDLDQAEQLFAQQLAAAMAEADAAEQLFARELAAVVADLDQVDGGRARVDSPTHGGAVTRA